MKQKICNNIRDPETLEQLYRENPREFKRNLFEIAADNDNELIRFWKIRLSDEPVRDRKYNFSEIISVIAISVVTMILVKLPAIFPSISETKFYTHDLPIIVFNGLILLAFFRNQVRAKWIVAYFVMILALLIYVNLLPERETDSIMIALFHVPLFLWCLFGAGYIAFDFRDTGKKMDFIRFNGELITMTGLLIISGGILTAITLGLFSAIGLNIEKTYMEYFVLPGGSVCPVIASFLIRLYPGITRRIVPVIARIFTPIALLTLLVYIVSLLFSRIRILEDRDLLIVFNILLIAVLAIIIFSVTELNKTRNKNFQVLVLLILAIVTLAINSVALAAIITRLTYGLTPNRTVVFVTNLLVFINLILIAKDLFRSYFDAGKLGSVEKTVAKYLTVYFIWTIVAIFVLPPLFGFN